MTIDEKIRLRLEDIFPCVRLDPFPDGLHIRTDQWMIDPDQLYALKSLGLSIDSIMVEGGSLITLIIDKESSNKVYKKK